MTEAQFQDRIVAYAELRSWHVSHVENVTMTGKGGRTVHRTPAARGFPDLVLARHGRVVFLEVKSESGSVSDGQVEWLNALAGVGHARSVWASRGVSPSGAAFVSGTVCDIGQAGDYWARLVAVVRPRHWDWIMEVLK